MIAVEYETKRKFSESLLGCKLTLERFIQRDNKLISTNKKYDMFVSDVSHNLLYGYTNWKGNFNKNKLRLSEIYDKNENLKENQVITKIQKIERII